MKSNDVVKVANFIQSRKITNIELIAESTYANNKEDYIKKFAENIVKEKLEKTELPQSLSGELRFLDYHDEKFLIMVSPVEILPKSGKENVKRHAHKMIATMKENNLSGAIYFMPFLMNNKNVRHILETEMSRKEMSIGFVNLPYGSNTLEKRIYEYVR